MGCCFLPICGQWSQSKKAVNSYELGFGAVGAIFSSGFRLKKWKEKKACSFCISL